ncbi:MAG TPA: biopolymer transporter ExbD [Planctomycetota bacterium]|nr:biopolymer transporter ExbD [Planctomycetota bacterium]
MALRRRHGPNNALLFLTVLPITPLVDIALLLLGFFLLAGQVAAHRELAVTLPKAGTAEAPAAALSVAISRDGAVSVGGEPVDLAQLKLIAADAPRVALHADAAVAHGRVVAVVDVLRAAGAGKVFYATTEGVSDW